MADSAVDFLLENLMQLINSDKELILEAYNQDKVVIEKEQIEWVYREIHFLRKFLKDSEEKRDEHEELKRLVVRIRDLSYKTEDIIDWFLLKAAVLPLRDGRSTAYDFDLLISTSSKNVVYKAYNISASLANIIKATGSLKKCKIEVMGILSWLCDHMADKIRDRFRGVTEEIKPIVKEAMNIIIYGSSLGWLETNVSGKAKAHNKVIGHRRLSREKNCEVDHILNTPSMEILDGFGSIIGDVTKKLSFPYSLCNKKIASLIPLSIQKIGEFDDLLNSSSKEIHNGFGSIIKEIKSIIEEAMDIHEKRSGKGRDFNFSPYGEKINDIAFRLSRANVCCEVFLCQVYAKEPREVDRLYELSGVFLNLAKKIWFHDNEDASDWPLFWLAEDYYLLLSTYEEMVDLAEKIGPRSFRSITEEIKHINTVVMKIYEKGLSVPWINSQMTCEILVNLLNLSIKLVDLAEKISNSFGCVIEETNSIKTEVMKIYQKGLRLSWLESVMGDEIHKSFGIVTEEIKSIRREVMKIYENNMYGIRVLRVEKSYSSIPTNFTLKEVVLNEELVVGFDDEMETIMELLIRQHDTQLKIIPIIGMPGLGKTTLAMKVYNNPLIEYQFHIRAWTHVSQAYWRRDLLLSILSSADIQLKGKIEKMSDEELGEGLYKSLKGKKYLVVMDDIWEITAWNDIKRYFPNDKNGSRIIFTSRNGDVALALPANPHYLRFLNSNESWDLLRQKVFQGGCCPWELIEIGKQIAKKCRGLPLAIVVIAGLLAKKDKTQDWWSHVAENVSSCIVSEQEQFVEQCMNTLALSYNHLPYYLKPCFLYFGAFPEDYEIPVLKLIWLWIAEGFIVRNQQKSLEEVAEDYMMDLIDRSLLIVSKKRSNGRIKACRVHDLLRDLCLRKAQEEKFFMRVSRHEPIFSSSSNPMATNQRRICISTRIDFFTIATLFNGCGHSKHGDPEVRSFSSTTELSMFYLESFFRAFKLLRVLNISSVKISSIPEGLQLLVHLRYLSIHIDRESFCPSISNLLKLETFIIEGGPIGFVSFSHDIWKLVKLRHLYAKRFIEIPHVPNDDDPFMLDDLQTLGKLDLRGVDVQFLRLIPNLKKLTCCFTESLGGKDIFPKLEFLVHLEKLNITYGESKGYLARFPHLDQFPPNLKSLTLSNFRLSWEEMSTLGKLPNLEVLKLSCKAFEGPRWDTSDGLFHKLKFLRFQRLDIKQWNAYSSHFPVLQTLVLDDCKQLEEIPSGLAYIFTLETIRLWYCSSSAAHSALQIKELQKEDGYDGLKIHIYPSNYVGVNDDDEDDAP